MREFIAGALLAVIAQGVVSLTVSWVFSEQFVTLNADRWHCVSMKAEKKITPTEDSLRIHCTQWALNKELVK